MLAGSGPHRMTPGATQCVRVLSILAQVLLIGSLTLFWLQLWFRGWINSANTGSIGEETAAVVVDARAAAAPDLDIMEGFFRLSLTLFERRQNTSQPWSTQDGTGGYLDFVQVVQVPRAGNRQLGVLAKKLVGCYAMSSSIVDAGAAAINGVSACQILGNPPTDCRKESLSCLKVLDRTVLANEMSVSLSQMRSPVERLVSAFLFGAHSPPCTISSQTKHEVQECFTAMARTQAFRNIAGRVYTGHSAYSDVPICHTSGERRNIKHTLKHTGRGGDIVQDDTSECGETLRSALAGLCLFNHIALTEAPGASALLLLETLPWIRPDRTFFEKRSVPLAWPSKEAQGHQDEDFLYMRPEVSRQGNLELEKLQYITQDLRDVASASNQVDEMLYDIVSAKMCSRLSSMNLLKHPVVEAELAACPLGERCASKEWYEGIIDSTKGVIETHSKGDQRCRLFQPLTRPPPA